MKRTAFNGGELSPELALRSDLDVYMRGCSVIENFDISQMGGAKRRRGMRPFADAMPGSRLIPYVYSNAERYIVEVAADTLRIYTPDGTLDWEHPCETPDVEHLRSKQVNALLILTSPAYRPMVLKRDALGAWTYEPFDFKFMPWRENEYRDVPIDVTRDATGTYSVTFPEDLPTVEREGCSGDILRASFYTAQQECFDYASNLINGVKCFEQLAASSVIERGSKVALHSSTSKLYYVCIADWDGAQDFVSGHSSPDYYPANFRLETSPTGFDNIGGIAELSSELSYSVGDKIVIVADNDTNYWNYWTCISTFNGASDFISGFASPDDYPGFFVRGLAVGRAVPCRGTWDFYCSGLWVGEYEVRRSYDGPDLSNEWESRDKSFSRIGAQSNTLLAGDEGEEECYLRLFITRSQYVSSSLISGFPEDTCSNRLVVSPYKHDLLLRYDSERDTDGALLAESWTCCDTIAVDFAGSRSIVDWSWQAYSDKYGYPSLCDIYNQRLVFASTVAQPQTIWMSATDDLNNFQLGKTDTSALALTMSTTTQNRICWLMTQGARLLLGTADAEHIVSSGNSQGITYANARIDNHGYVGSADTPALMATDKVVYIERGSGRLYQYGYDFASDAYISRDLTVFSDHILRGGGGVRDGCFIRKPDARAAFVLQDGTAALMTYNSLHEVNCWHRYTTEGSIEHCAVLPNGTEADSLFLIVQREGGRYIEVIDDRSPYIDHDTHDYTSTLITNALIYPDRPARPELKGDISICFGAPTEAEGITVTIDGDVWDDIDRNGNGELLPAGWNRLIASSMWHNAAVVGLRVAGERPLHVLAMQG